MACIWEALSIGILHGFHGGIADFHVVHDVHVIMIERITMVHMTEAFSQ